MENGNLVAPQFGELQIDMLGIVITIQPIQECLIGCGHFFRSCIRCSIWWFGIHVSNRPFNTEATHSSAVEMHGAPGEELPRLLVGH